MKVGDGVVKRRVLIKVGVSFIKLIWYVILVVFDGKFGGGVG